MVRVIMGSRISSEFEIDIHLILIIILGAFDREWMMSSRRQGRPAIAR